MTFGPTDQVFTGFRVTREKPVLLLWLGLVFAITSGLTIALAYPAFVQLMTYVASVQAGHEPSQQEMMSLVGPYGHVLMFGVPLSLIGMAVVMPAIVRAVLMPEDSRFGYLRLGRDELNVFVVLLLMSLVWMSFVFVAGMIVGIASMGGIAVAMLIGLMVLVALAVAGVWLAVKFSLAIPITVVEKRLGLLESYRMTKGHFWPLLGMGLLAAVLSFGVSLLVNIIAIPFATLSGGGYGPITGGTVSILTVAGMTGSVLLSIFVSAAQSLIIYAPFASVYRALKSA